MTLEFYCGSGSPFAWRVWLALEHKQVPYELKMLSFSGGDHRKPEFLALNPRHKVPVIADDGFALYESSAIVEYLDERFPDGPPLFPGDVRKRAVIRRIIREVESYVAPAHDLLGGQLFSKTPETWDEAKISEGRERWLRELAMFEPLLAQPWLAAEHPSAADHALVPYAATCYRFETKKPDLALVSAWAPNLRAWFERVRALPYYAKTYPPHWRE